MSLRAWAAFLVLAAILPLGLFGWFTLHSMAQNQAAAFTKSQTDTSRVLASAVDGELHAWKVALGALAQSHSLRPGHLSEFYDEARAVAAQHEGWIVLSDPSGQQLLNTLRPFGSPLPKGNPVILSVLQAQRPVVFDLFFGTLVQRYVLDVAVPITRDGKPAYILDMAFTPDRLTGLLKRQALPATWVLVIFDSQQRVVTQLPRTEERMGQAPSPWVAAALRASPSGMVTGIDLWGVPHRVAFNRLTEAPWSVTISIPLTDFPSPRPIYGFIALGLLLGGCALTGAIYASRKLTGPVTELATRAETILRGDIPEAGSVSGVREIQYLEQALVRAAANVQTLHEERTRATAAEERAKAETAAAAVLRESEERFRAFVTASSEVVYRMNADWREMRQLHGREFLADTDAPSRTWLDRYIPPEDQPHVLAAIHEAIRDKQPFELEHRVRRADGSVGWTFSRAIPVLDDRGAIVEWFGAASDITARKQAEAALRASEEQFRVLTQNLQSGVALVDDRGAFSIINSAFRRLFDLPPNADILNVNSRDWAQWQVFDERGAPLEVDEHPVRKAARSRTAVKNQLVAMRAPACPDLKWLLVSAEPILDAQGGIHRLICTYYDITALKQAEEQLRQTLVELERSNLELEQFAYVASHDLQEPIRMVASFTQLLAERYQDRLDQPAKEFIAFAVDGATRMQRLIQDLLTYSRVRTHGELLTLTDAQTALQRALANLQAAIQEAGAVVSHDALPKVWADATQLTQLFQNLVGNAIKFHGDAPPRVHVSATPRGEDWVFAVADNGIGIAPEYFDRIFAIFQRLHPPHRYPGTGIGLALCQRIVQRHGGRLWVESTPGQGATFSFTLKRQEGVQP